MKKDINEVQVIFDALCPKCGTTSEPSTQNEQGNCIKTTIAGIIDNGVPICDDCGEDLPVFQYCQISEN